jgi:hypothetical protein
MHYYSFFPSPFTAENLFSKSSYEGKFQHTARSRWLSHSFPRRFRIINAITMTAILPIPVPRMNVIVGSIPICVSVVVVVVVVANDTLMEPRPIPN